MLAKLVIASSVMAAGLATATTTVAAEPKPSALSVHAWTNSVPRAFLKDRHLRLYSSGAGEPVLFHTDWSKSRVAAQEFTYSSAMLKRDTSPPPLPATSSSWREIKVLDVAQSEPLLRAIARHLVPAEHGHGVYSQYAFGDVVLFRDAAGTVKLVPFEEKPADVIIDRRYSRHELASAAAGSIEKELRAGYENETAFVVLWRRGGRLRLTFLDLEARESIVLFPPADDIQRGRPKLGGNLRTLASFAVVDNAWAFLKNPVSSATRTVHQGLQWTATLFDGRLRGRVKTIPPLTPAPGMDLIAWEDWLDRHGGPRREYGSIRLLNNGEGFYPEFERRVAEARSSVDIHVCIFDRDDVAVRMAELLKARSTNITVRVVFDRLNTRGAGGAAPATPMADGFVPPDSILSTLRDGGDVRVRPLLNPGFSCDHSKVFIIDEHYAYIGGMNFGREYRYEWHDLMAEVEGPIVASLQRQFNKKWAQAGLWGDCGLATETLCGLRPDVSTNRPEWFELRRLYTKTFDRQIRRAQLEAVRRARSHIFLENSYLYSNEMILALARARLRGVDVRVIMPGENDFAPGHSSNLVTSNFLRRHGVRIYFYPGMSHVKALLVDGWVCFGSANFDSLSLRLNREGNLATSDAGFTARFRREVFDVDFAKARELKEEIAVDWSDDVSDAFLNLF